MKRGTIVSAVLGLSLALCLPLLARKTASGGEGPAAQRRTSEESPNVRFCRASLKLAQLTLQEANEANQRMAHTFPKTQISRLEQDVRLAELRLKAALEPAGRSFREENLLLAEAAITVADADYQQALRANQRAPGTIGKTKLERLRMEVEAARLHLERERTLADDTTSRLTDVQWQMELLRDEVIHLRNRVEQLSELN